MKFHVQNDGFYRIPFQVFSFNPEKHFGFIFIRIDGCVFRTVGVYARIYYTSELILPRQRRSVQYNILLY